MSTQTKGASQAPAVAVPDLIIDGENVIKYDAETDSVTIPYWYFEKLYDYIVDTQAAQQINEASKEK